MRTVILNGRLIDRETDRRTDILIEGGKVAGIGDFSGIPADTVIQAGGLIVSPGFIDLHVHLREPGFEYKETIRTGAMAAARGGFTTICCMPNTKPVPDSPELIRLLIDKAAVDSAVKVLPIGSITKAQLGAEVVPVADLKKAGAVAVSEDGKSVSDPVVMAEALRLAALAGVPVFDHCEEPGLAPGASSEELIVARDIILAAHAGARIHICHISTAGSCEIVRAAKRLGLAVTAECAPHHFTLCEDDIVGDDGNFKMNPPLRSARDLAAVTAALRDGTIDVIATDHAPHSAEEKNQGYDKAQNGIVGLETALALSYSELVRKGVLSLSQMIDKLRKNPAGLIEAEPGLSIGSPADICIFDTEDEYAIDTAAFVSMGKNSPFGGRKVRGRVKYTLVDGNIVYREN